MRFLTFAIIILSLTGCGTAYFSPSVVEETTASGEVSITPITATSVAAANSSPYRPKTLPAIFSRTTDRSSGQPEAGTLPDPVFYPEIRPPALITRLPPPYRHETYRIGISDVVLLAIPQAGNTVAELSGLLAAQNGRQGYTVQNDGAIAIPDVGRIELAGMTVEEAEAELFRRLLENQFDPIFSLEIAEFHSQRVALGGALRNPTVAPITLTALHLDEALNAAGGVSTADLDYVMIRLYRDGTIYQIPFIAFLEDTAIQKITLKGGDSIFVDSEFNLANAHAYFQEQIQLLGLRQQSRETALSELAAEVALRRDELVEARTNYQTRIELDAIERDYVYLTGELGQQSRFTLPFGRNANLADALFDRAGGIPTKTGNIAEVYVLRANQTRSGITAWHLDARNAANLMLATQFELRPNDVIFVAEQPVTRWNRVLQQITPSFITTTIGALAN